jgi:hypothetical protein
VLRLVLRLNKLSSIEMKMSAKVVTLLRVSLRRHSPSVALISRATHLSN